jgi:8-oxo-dGTP pyrophosphatase MutT (NUDIX family)
MPMSEYLEKLRGKVGHDLLLLPSAAVAIQDKEKGLLLCKHADRSIWVTPGGLIEPGEHPADAAVRETWEETGLNVEITAILGVYGGPDLIVDYPNGDQAAYIGTIFRARITGGTMRPDGSEILDVRYFMREELIRVPHSRWMDHCLDVLYATNAMPHFVPPSWKPPH